MKTNGIKSSSKLIEDMQEVSRDNTFDSCLISSDRNNNVNNNINNKNKEKKKKRVKFSGEIIFIDVECWKKYNMELTADENFNINEEENNENEKNNNDNKNNKKKENIFCTCNII